MLSLNKKIMENNNTESSNTGAIIAKFVGMILLVIVVGAVIYFIMQMTNQSPAAKAASELFGAGAKLFLIPTEACTYATTCKGMGETDCKNDDSDECAWNVSTKKCYNNKGRKAGTGGPTSLGCWLGIGEFALICASIVSFLSLGFTSAGRKAVGNFFLNESTKNKMTSSSSSPETVILDAVKAGNEAVGKLYAVDENPPKELINMIAKQTVKSKSDKDTYEAKTEKEAETRQADAQESYDNMKNQIKEWKNNNEEEAKKYEKALDEHDSYVDEQYGVTDGHTVPRPTVPEL